MSEDKAKLLAALQKLQRLHQLRNRQSDLLHKLTTALVLQAMGGDVTTLSTWQDERAQAIAEEAWRKLQALK